MTVEDEKCKQMDNTRRLGRRATPFLVLKHERLRMNGTTAAQPTQAKRAAEF